MDLIDGLMKKVGLTKEKASEVVSFLKENAAKVPEWIGKNEKVAGLAAKLPGGLGDKLLKKKDAPPQGE